MALKVISLRLQNQPHALIFFSRIPNYSSVASALPKSLSFRSHQGHQYVPRKTGAVSNQHHCSCMVGKIPEQRKLCPPTHQMFWSSPLTTSSPSNNKDNDTASTGGVKPQHNIRPKARDKWILVYTKTYPNMESIPDVVPTSKMANSRDKMRAQLSILFVAIGLVVCFGISVYGSRARRAQTGKSMRQYTEEQVNGK